MSASVLQALQTWFVDETGSISRQNFREVLRELGSFSDIEVDTIYEHVSGDNGGGVGYQEFVEWLCHGELSSDLVGELRCPDDHVLNTFAPAGDGWCCEECGEDLQIGVQCLQCCSCDGLCFCIPCIAKESPIGVIGNIVLNVARATLLQKMSPPSDEVGANQVIEQRTQQHTDDGPAPPQVESEEEHFQPQLRFSEIRAGPIELTVGNLAGLLCTVVVDRTETFLEVKKTIQQKMDLPVLEQRLHSFTSMVLQDSDLVGSVFDADSAEVILLRRTQEQAEVFRKLSRGCIHLGEAPEELRADPELVLQAVGKVGTDLYYASNDLRANHVIVRAAIMQNPAAVQFALGNCRANRDIILLAVAGRGDILFVAADELRSDREIAVAALKSSYGQALVHVSAELQGDDELVEIAYQSGFRLHSYRPDQRRLREHEGFLLSLARHDVSQLRHASQDVLKKSTFALAAVRQSGASLQYLPDQFHRDVEVVEVALRNGFYLKASPKEIRANPFIVSAAVRRCGDDLQYADPGLQADRKIVMAAIKQDALALQYAAFKFRNDLAVVLAAVQRNPAAREFAAGGLKNDPKIIAACLGLAGRS